MTTYHKEPQSICSDGENDTNTGQILGMNLPYWVHCIIWQESNLRPLQTHH